MKMLRHLTLNLFTLLAMLSLPAAHAAPTLTTVSTLTGATEDTALTISYETLAEAANEADAQGAALSFRVEAVTTGTLEKGSGSAWTAVTAGTTLVSAGDTLRWTPAANANGTLNTFTIKAWDGALASASAVQVTINVAAVNDAPVLAGLSTTYDAFTDFVAGATLQSAGNRWQYLGGSVSELALLTSWKTGGNAVIPGIPQWDGDSGHANNYPFVQRVSSAQAPIAPGTLVIHPANTDASVRAVAVGWKNTANQTVSVEFGVTLRMPYSSDNGIDYFIQRGLAGSSRYLLLRSGTLVSGGSVALASSDLLEMQAGEMLYLIVDSKGNFGYDHTELSNFTVTVIQGPVLNPISKDVSSDANPGTAVSVLANFGSDVDAGALKGIAVTSLDSSNGSWQYTIDGGGNWGSLSGVSSASARLLKADELHRVRFNPNSNFNGTATIQYRVWDQVNGVDGDLVDLKMVEGGGWALVAYGANASLGGSLIAAAGNFSPSVRTGSAVLPALNLLKSSAELAMSWTGANGGFPVGGIASYNHAVAFALPNASVMSFDGSATSPPFYMASFNAAISFAVGSTHPDQSLVTVRTPGQTHLIL
jgi:hypothetical protein